jgi:hypothetical protein
MSIENTIKRTAICNGWQEDTGVPHYSPGHVEFFEVPDHNFTPMRCLDCARELDSYRKEQRRLRLLFEPLREQLVADVREINDLETNQTKIQQAEERIAACKAECKAKLGWSDEYFMELRKAYEKYLKAGG